MTASKQKKYEVRKYSDGKHAPHSNDKVILATDDIIKARNKMEEDPANHYIRYTDKALKEERDAKKKIENAGRKPVRR